ncbi:MAG: hypothetical protein HY661_06570 [Betaproteobacteria bacterium]|nr:hypothetical protein [Betaproteobacteria bacterium]
MTIHLKVHPVSRWLLGAIVLSAASPFFSEARAGTGEPPIPRGVAMASWQDNGRGGQYLLKVVQGRALAKRKSATGTVKSDSNCDIDAQGLSHCNNTIELADGSRITVIDTHNMHRNRCLQPGERISLTGIGGAWIMGTVSGG